MINVMKSLIYGLILAYVLRIVQTDTVKKNGRW